jgi:hypothetical protein
MEKNQFCLPLNLPNIVEQIKKEYIEELLDLRARDKHQSFIGFTGKEIPEFVHELFSKLELTPCSWKINMFTSSALEIQKIHLDGDPLYPEKFRPFAINWVWGGRTLMEWFKNKESQLPEYTDWNEFRYVEFNEDNCNKVHKEVLTGANLVNIAHPHRVINVSKERRFCFSICSNEILSWQEITELCYQHNLVRI